MTERLKGIREIGTAVATARAFVYTLRHASPFVDPTKEYWNNLSPFDMGKLLDNLADPNDKERGEIKRILKDVEAQSVLDAGCGPATEFDSYRLNGLGDIRYVGLDLSQRMLEAARQRHDGISLVRSDVESMPFTNCSFDVVVVRHIVEHQPIGYEKVVIEALRVARKAVVVDFFLPPTVFGFDIKLANRGGVSTNWYSKSKFEKFVLGLPQVSYLDLTRVPNKFGQLAAIYTIRK